MKCAINNLLIFQFLIMHKCICGSFNEDAINDSIVVTVASERTDGYERFIDSAKHYKINVVTLGLGTEWLGGDMNHPGGGYKINLLKEHLAPFKSSKDKIVLFTDSYDVIFLNSLQKIIQEFKNTKSKVLFGAENFCWPEEELKEKYPAVEGRGYRFLNSGMFIGYAENVYNILTYAPVKDKDDDQLFYTLAYLDEKLRETNGIQLDHKATIFQNLNGAKNDVTLEINNNGESDLINNLFGTKPMIVHGNGPSKSTLNNFGNYLAGAYVNNECVTCLNNIIEEKDAKVYSVLIALFIEKPTPFLEEFFESVAALDYPKDQIHIFIHNNVEFHNTVVNEAIEKFSEDKYNSVKLIGVTDGISEATARELAVNHCLNKNCDYLFAIDAEARVDNPDTLLELIMFNKTIIAPIVARHDSVWTNFWGAIGDKGYYARAPDYMSIVNNDIRGIWNVPYITQIYLLKSSVLNKISYTQKGIDPDMAFCKHLRAQNIFMYATNYDFYGHLVNNEHFDIKRTKPDFYELFTNQIDWEKRFIHPEYSKYLEPDHVPTQPCPDVYWFPIGTDAFADSLVEIVEAFGQWSDGSNMDKRLQGGYEAVPTRDIHMNQVGLEPLWLKFLQLYVKPFQEKVFIGYFHDPPRSLMNFVVRYKPDEQPSLRPHHDSSTYTINIALNHVDEDFEGGGCRFIRYNCSVRATKKGYMLMHPGRLTHFHEGLTVTSGTRYIMVSFVDP